MLFILWGMICGEVDRRDAWGRPYKAFIGEHFARHCFGPARVVQIANDNAASAA